MSDITTKNDPNNRGREELYARIWTIWQGHVESNHDLRFWRPLY